MRECLKQGADIFRTLSLNPRLAARAVNRFYYQLVAADGARDGVDVIAEDWDNLLLLDACRYDIFEAVCNFSGTLEQKRSRASNTVQFLQTNVAGRDLTDTVYITANPQYRKHKDTLEAEFHAVLDLWEHGWNEKFQTVCPETTTEHALEAAERFPNKRLIVHYNQPHVPFIGPIGQEHFDLSEITAHPLTFWQQPMAGDWNVDNELIRQAYTENLELVLPYVEELIAELCGRTIVTADHGNMLGERVFPVPIREYGHPCGIYTEQLIKIPWFISNSDDRKNIVAERNKTSAPAEYTDTVDDRLQYLGYK